MQAHHYNGYDRPLDVQWLCVQCHRDETPLNPRKGEEHANAKLSWEKVRHIRQRLMSQRAYARMYGVDQRMICFVQMEVWWKEPLNLLAEEATR